MRILIATPLYPPDIGGPATYSKTLVDELPKEGIEVTVISFGSVRHLPKIIRHVAYFFKIISRGRINDIIYAQDPVSVGFPAVLAAMILRKKFIVKIVGDYAWEQAVQRFGVKELLDDFLPKSYGLRVGILRFLERFVAHRASLIIVPSIYLKSVVQAWGIASEKIHVIYNDVVLPKQFLSKESARRHLEISAEEKLLVSVGRLVPWKCFALLIDCVPTILTHYPKTELLIIGDGPEHVFLQKKIDQMGLQNHVSLMGKISREAVLNYVAAADIFLLNTAYEGFSHQLLEAFSLGVPTLTTLAGGNKELVELGKNALGVKFNDKEEWVKAIVHLLDNPSLAKALGDTARITVRPFQNNSMIKKISTVLRTL